MSRQVENSNLKMGEYAVQEKDKSASFSLQPYISWKLWAGFKNSKKNSKKKKKTHPITKPWTGLENWTTSSFGVHPCKETQPGEKVRKNKKLQLKTSLHLKMKQCKEEKGKAKKVISHWGLQVVTTQLWFDKIQSDAICGLTRNDEEDVFVNSS